jgi:hypothetical protein
MTNGQGTTALINLIGRLIDKGLPGIGLSLVILSIIATTFNGYLAAALCIVGLAIILLAVYYLVKSRPDAKQASSMHSTYRSLAAFVVLVLAGWSIGELFSRSGSELFSTPIGDLRVPASASFETTKRCEPMDFRDGKLAGKPLANYHERKGHVDIQDPIETTVEDQTRACATFVVKAIGGDAEIGYFFQYRLTFPLAARITYFLGNWFSPTVR